MTQGLIPAVNPLLGMATRGQICPLVLEDSVLQMLCCGVQLLAPDSHEDAY